LERVEKEETKILEKMREEEWISFKEGQIVLKEEGERRAKEVIRRHRLAERLLSEVLAKIMDPVLPIRHILARGESVCLLGHLPFVTMPGLCNEI
jgi:DtxR family Mn-dependent transcriptional regulator